MFPYLRTAKEFIEDCGETEICDEYNCDNCTNKSELTKWLEDCVKKANWLNGVRKDEIKAWCQSVCVYLRDVIKEVNRDDLYIGLEYYIETREGIPEGENGHNRADVLIGGYGKGEDDKKEIKILVIELKQYSEVTEILSEANTIKWKYKNKSKPDECPNSQVKFYCENMSKSLDKPAANSCNIRFIPCVYMHNLDMKHICKGKPGKSFEHDKNNITLEDNRVCFENKPVKIYLKGSKNNLVDDISKTFNWDGDISDNKKNVFKELKKRYHTFSVKELADILVCNKKNLEEKFEKRLRPDQFFILNGYSNNFGWDNYIKNHIDYIKYKKSNPEGEYEWKHEENKNGNGFTGNCILDVIEGGPGSGKTLLAMLIIRYCRDNELSVSFINCKSAPKNAICKYLKKDSENEEKYKVKKDVFQKKYIKYFNRVDSDVYILDEAHTIDRDISGIIKNKMQGDSPKLIICMYDKRQILNENSLVFINNIEGIDGFKKDETNVIQTNTPEVGKCNKYKIWSQFRCNRDEGFVSWIEDKFEIENSSYPRPFVNYINSPASFDYDVEIIDKDDLNGEFLEDIRDKIDEGSLFPLSEDVDNDEIKEMLDMNKSVQKPFMPGTLKSADDEIIYRGDTTTICGIENEEILVFVKDVYKNNKISCNEITKNKYRILLTRGLKKCYICCLDDGLKEYLLK